MKYTDLFYSIVATIFLMGLVSCSDDNNDNDTEFAISYAGRQSMIDGVVEHIDIAGGSSQYTVESDDESIATATIETRIKENKIYYYAKIKAIAKGKVTFTISDGKVAKSIEVDIVDPYRAYMINNLQYIITSETKDEETSALIKNDLNARTLPLKTVFLMVKDEDRTLYLYKNAEELENKKPYIAKGTYEFIKREGEELPNLNLTIDEKTYIYKIDEVDNSVRRMLDFYVPNWSKVSTFSYDTQWLTVTLEEDLTEEYAAKYPYITISSVQVSITLLERDPAMSPLPSK